MRTLVVCVGVFAVAAFVSFFYYSSQPDGDAAVAVDPVPPTTTPQTYTITIERADGSLDRFDFPSRPYISGAENGIMVGYETMDSDSISYADRLIPLEPGDRVIDVSPPIGESIAGAPSPVPGTPLPTPIETEAPTLPATTPAVTEGASQ